MLYSWDNDLNFENWLQICIYVQNMIIPQIHWIIQLPIQVWSAWQWTVDTDDNTLIRLRRFFSTINWYGRVFDYFIKGKIRTELFRYNQMRYSWIAAFYSDFHYGLFFSVIKNTDVRSDITYDLTTLVSINTCVVSLKVKILYLVQRKHISNLSIN